MHAVARTRDVQSATTHAFWHHSDELIEPPVIVVVYHVPAPGTILRRFAQQLRRVDRGAFCRLRERPHHAQSDADGSEQR